MPVFSFYNIKEELENPLDSKNAYNLLLLNEKEYSTHLIGEEINTQNHTENSHPEIRVYQHLKKDTLEGSFIDQIERGSIQGLSMNESYFDIPDLGLEKHEQEVALNEDDWHDIN